MFVIKVVDGGFDYKNFLVVYIIILVFLLLYVGYKIVYRMFLVKLLVDIDVVMGKKEMDEWCEGDVKFVLKNWL